LASGWEVLNTIPIIPSYPYNLAVDLLGLTLLSRTAEDISEMDLLEATVVFFFLFLSAILSISSD
jgi:hypothetical protein